jgi:hypothetical protein
MIPQRSLLATAGFGLIVAAVLAGCGTSPADPEALELREKFLISEEPASVVTLTELAARFGIRPDGDAQSAAAESASVGEGVLPADDIADTKVAEETPVAEMPAGRDQVSVVGRIFAGELEPWDPGKAAFLIAELPDEGHGEGHDADNCPFCKRKAARAPTAMVQFLDDSGTVIPIDARKLLGVEKKDVVVIIGEATVGDLNSVVIHAKGLHIRRK